MNAVDIISILAAFAVTGWFDAERYGEDDARDFFDEHGHWPDEDPADAEAQRRRSAEAERVARRSYRGG
jgi:hypothetical protein